MRGIKIPHQDFALKRQGGLMCEGGVFVGHYSIIITYVHHSPIFTSPTTQYCNAKGGE